MAREWTEWLESPRTGRTAATAALEESGVDFSSKRCPRCGWLDQAQVSECFRCGYNYLSGDLCADYFRAHPIGLPDPTLQIPEFDEWKLFGRRSGKDPLSEFFLRLQAEQCCLVRGFESLISLDELNIIHYEHQLHTALTVLNDLRGQALLADEVGLGKTIEAGIILKELIKRGLAAKILIITPASLMTQWQDELLNKFAEDFTIATEDEDWLKEKVICSFSRLRLPRSAQKAGKGKAAATKWEARDEGSSGPLRILQQDYDVLIVDEAHKLKHRGTQRFQFVRRIRKKYVLMLTATPVHNNLTELYNLITVLKPGLLGTIRSFKRHFVASGDGRKPKNEAYLKKLLASVMIRNRRSDVNIRFPARKSAICHLTLTDAERRLYDAVSEYIRHEFKAQTQHQFHLLSLSTLQKELCSSSRAVKATLDIMAKKPQYPEITRTQLQAFSTLAAEITRNRKIEALLDILENYPGKFLVFTEFLNTMSYIREHLEAAGLETQLFHGRMNIIQRRDAVRKFSRSARVMISTQAGGEGMNLQFCHQLVNYDLPWNPMMLEQRIGRLHRLGQEDDVLIFNFSVHNTIEAHVLDLLSRKIRMFELVVGELDLILSELDENAPFERKIREIWLHSTSEKDMQQRFEHFGARLVHARRHFEKLKEAEAITSDLFDV